MEILLMMVGMFAAFCWGLSWLWNRDGGAAPGRITEPHAPVRGGTDPIRPGNVLDNFDDDDVFSKSGTASDDDWFTNPIYAFYPGNIYHHDDTPIGSCSTGTDSDWMTDPSCSYMPGNIYYEDNFGCGSSLTDDSFSCFDSHTSACDIDCSSSACDDNWTSSTNDD